MLKVLLVEDEFIERQYLKELINNTKKVKVVGESSNGYDAVRKTKALKPDIILMDIQMPKKDGLQASKEIKKELKDIEIVILTAYSKFEYAKGAIKIGIEDFLLKPYSDRELFNVIETIIKKSEKKKQDKRYVELLKKQAKAYNLTLEREIVINLINNNKVIKENIEQYVLNKSISYTSMQCFLIKVTKDSIVNHDSLLKIKEIFLFKMNDMIIQRHFNTIIILTFNSIKDFDFLDIISEMDYLFKGKLKSEYCIAKGNPITDISQLNQSYIKNLNYVRNYEFDENYDRERMDIQSILDHHKENIMGLLIRYDYQLTNKELMTLFNKIEDKKIKIETVKINIYTFYKSLYENLLAFFGNKLYNDIFDSKIEQKIKESSSLEQLKPVMQSIITGFSDMVQKERKTRAERQINLVIQYLENNYNKDISLNIVSEKFLISPSHLSRMFKQVTGTNYKDYLMRIRMERAKALLREETNTVASVAFEVGYEDPNYFSRVFKKFTGFSPTEYMNV